MDKPGDETTFLVNVSGRHYEVEGEALHGLAGMTQARFRPVDPALHHGHQGELYFRRRTDCWEAVLDFLQTGELHMPQTVCPRVFKRELTFWGVEAGSLAKCCHHRLQGFLQDLETLDNFDKAQAASLQEVGVPLSPQPSCWQRARHRGWLVLDQPTSSRAAKVYFCLTMLMVLVSVLAMILSSMASLRFALSNDQWREVLGKNVRVVNDTHFELSDYDDDYDWSGEVTTSGTTTETASMLSSDSPDPSTASPSSSAGRRKRAAPGPAASPSPSPQTSSASPPSSSDSQASSTELSDPSWPGTDYGPAALPPPGNPPGSAPKVSVPKTTTSSIPRYMSAPPRWIFFLDIVVVVFFSGELLARLLCCPDRRRYLFKWYNAADVLALLGSVVLAVLHWLLPQYKYSRNIVDIIAVLKVLRLLRFFRPLSHVRGFKVLTFTLVTSAVDLVLLLGLLFLAVLTFGSLLYYTDTSNTSIKGIPDAAWWALVTMTTVGYGDVVPSTRLAQVVGACCAISGVVLLASIMPIFVNTFLLIYSYSKVAPAERPRERDGKEAKGDDVNATELTAIKGKTQDSRDEKTGIGMELPGAVAMGTRNYDVPAYVKKEAIPSSPPPPFSYQPSDQKSLLHIELPNQIS